MFEKVREFIEENNMIHSGDRIGVACSGGIDSMCLLHYLCSLRDKLNFSVCVINIDHNLRDHSADDSKFVLEYCKQHDIPVYMYKINAKRLALDKGYTIEQA